MLIYLFISVCNYSTRDDLWPPCFFLTRTMSKKIGLVAIGTVAAVAVYYLVSLSPEFHQIKMAVVFRKQQSVQTPYITLRGQGMYASIQFKHLPVRIDQTITHIQSQQLPLAQRHKLSLFFLNNKKGETENAVRIIAENL